MYEEENAALSNYLPTLKRYKWHVSITAIILFILTTAIVLSLSPVYRSTGKVLVETQQIPTELVRSTVTSVAAERIEMIRQRVMTRDRLLSVIEKYSFFNLPTNNPAVITMQLQEVRESVNINIIEGVGGSRRGPMNTIAFSLSFDSVNPFIAQAVANDLVTLFLSENVKVRTERASETTHFLKSEADKIKIELDETEAAVADFKQQNKDALPEHLNLYVDIREESGRRLSEIVRDVRSTEEQISFIRSQRQLINGESDSGAIQGSALKLEQLKQELNRLLLSYKPIHPDVVEIKRQINFLEASEIPSESGRRYTVSELGVEQQLSELNSKMDSLLREKRIVEEKISDMEERILRIPQVERKLTTLTRENKSKIKQYNLLVAKSMEAGVAESLEEGLKAERFSLLEPPIQPTTPFKPDRKKLLLLSTGFSFGLPVGLVLLLGFLNKNIIGTNALMSITNLPVLAEIPHVYSDDEVIKNRQKVITILAFAIILVLTCLSVIHFIYMPLGDIINKMLVRLELY